MLCRCDECSRPEPEALVWVMVVATGLCLADGLYIDKFATIATFGEHYSAVDEGIDSVILAKANVQARMVNRATLTLDDVTGLASLATKNLNTESLAF